MCLNNIKESINCFHLGYVIGPRINAGGRVGKSSLGTEILLSSNQKETDIIAKKLGEFNNLRKKIESQVETQACTMVNENNIICVNSNNWHPGVIGIVASKLTEKYNKPSIVISEDSKICTASCRSIPGFDIGQLIHEAVKNNVIEAGGGHKMAAGFKIQIKKIPELKNFIKAKCNIIKISNRNFYDDEVKLSSIDKSLCDEVEKLSPFGQGNSTPKFLIKDCIIKFCRVVGDNHLSCTVEDIYGNRFKAISFNALKNSVYKYIQEKMSGMFDLIVILKKNNWRGKETVELQIEDVI